MMAALAPADEVMAEAATDGIGAWAPVSNPVSIKPCVDMAVLVRMHSIDARRKRPSEWLRDLSVGTSSGDVRTDTLPLPLMSGLRLAVYGARPAAYDHLIRQ